MSIRIMSQVWDSGPEDRAELLVLLALADFANDAGECWPSMIGIAAKARMTERGAQKIVRRLEETGWLEIATGGGRGGKNSYRIKVGNPERETGNTKRGIDEKPRTGKHKPRTGEQKTPNGGSPEPSITIREPSINKTREALCRVLKPDTADDFIEHRKAKGAKLTPRAAELIAAKLEGASDPDAAIFESIANGWTGVFPKKEPKASSPAKAASDDMLAQIWKSLANGTQQ